MYYNVPWDDLKNGKPVPPIETSWGDDTEMKIEQRGNITNRSYGRGFLDGVREGLRVISEAQTVDAIEIPKNITNGERKAQEKMTYLEQYITREHILPRNVFDWLMEERKTGKENTRIYRLC